MTNVKELQRKYEKPVMQVVLLRQRTMLLAGSNGTGELQNYNWSTPDEE